MIMFSLKRKHEKKVEKPHRFCYAWYYYS